MEHDGISCELGPFAAHAGWTSNSSQILAFLNLSNRKGLIIARDLIYKTLKIPHWMLVDE